MSKATIIFTFNGIYTTVECNKNEKMRNILERYKLKVEIDINKVYLLYNGIKVNEELRFEELANGEDKKMNMMNIIIYDINESTIIEEKIEKSKDIICPKCKENILIKIKDYKINMYGCKYNDIIKDIKIKELENTQKIDISKIICNKCKKLNKGNVYKNEFYKCIECNKNICPLCKSIHNKNHIIIEYDKIKYICNKHKEKYIKYCKECKMNICKLCKKEHKNHDKICYKDILQNENNELKEYINKLINDIIKDIKIKE